MNMPELLLTITSLGVGAVALLLAWRTRREFARLQAQVGEWHQQQQFQQQSISGLTAGAVGMDRRLNRMEATEKLLHDRQQTFENQQASEQPYSHAIRLVQQGASAQRLVEELSLSTSEAELIVRLHGLRDSA
jgi:hypothetical protein